MASTRDPLRIALQVSLYVFFYVLALYIFAPLLGWVGGLLAGATLGVFVAALFSNLISLRIYEAQSLPAIGLKWNRRSGHNLCLGLAGGAGSASLVLCAPLLWRGASIQPHANPDAGWPTVLFTLIMLGFGSAGEEILFRGYGFQLLMRSWGPWASILPVGILFGALHAQNPHASALGVINTVGFGILFGYAFYRSRDLWLPIGLHFGWNLTLPLFGVNVSGIAVRITSYALQWRAGPVWSGGEYGPEASILTSVVLLGLVAFLWKAPVQQQANALLDG
jgi:membrane protease YdiL (CAAX protease family)